MSLTSIVIPSRNDMFLHQTVNDLLQKAEGDVEIIIALDGYWPENVADFDERVRVFHHGTIHNSYGMRAGINAAMAIAKGDYVMKIDEHCMVDQGFDVKLQADCEENWVIIPRRKRLDAVTWTVPYDPRPDIDYMQVDFAYQRPNDNTCGLHGSEWKQRAIDRKDILIDETPTSQGSCYFMTKGHWDRRIIRMDEEHYGTFTHESQEIDFKTWFSGGKVMVNKKTWYAHYHKGSRGKNYGFSNAQYQKHQADKERGRKWCRDYWLNQQDYPHDWAWFIDEKFPGMPGWEGDWKQRLLDCKKLETL